jgi:hypothetical protein
MLCNGPTFIDMSTNLSSQILEVTPQCELLSVDFFLTTSVFLLFTIVT